MTVKTVFNPSLILALQDAQTPRDSLEVIHSMMEWVNYQPPGDGPYTMLLSDETRDWLDNLLHQNGAQTDFAYFTKLNSLRTQKYQIQGIVYFFQRILANESVLEACLPNAGSACTFDASTIQPVYVPQRAGPVYDAARTAEKNDVRLLATEEPEETNTYWLIVAYPPGSWDEQKKRLPQAFEVKSTKTETAGKPGKKSKNMLVCKKVPVAFRPRDLFRWMSEEEKYAVREAQVKRAVRGKRAIFMGGDQGHWGRHQAEIESLGFDDPKFYRCYGQTEEIAQAIDAMQMGHYDYFFHFIEFGSHAVSNIQHRRPETCKYIQVKSVSRQSVVLALSEALNGL